MRPVPEKFAAVISIVERLPPIVTPDDIVNSAGSENGVKYRRFLARLRPVEPCVVRKAIERFEGCQRSRLQVQEIVELDQQCNIEPIQRKLEKLCDAICAGDGFGFNDATNALAVYRMIVDTVALV